MIKSEEHLRSLTDAFHAAALGTGSWYEALDGLAKATGSSTGELIGIGLNTIEFNVMTNVDMVSFNRDFLASGGHDPSWNIRVRAGMSAPILKALAESDFISPSEHKRDPHYQEFSRRWDFLYTCLATLDRNENGVVGLAVLRSEREGHITDAQRQVFATLAPFVRSAVLTQKALEGQGTAVLAGAMEALSMPAFVCDRHQRVRALTPTAEALLERRCGLRLKSQQLRAERDADAASLEQAIRIAVDHANPRRPLLQTVVVRSCNEAHQPLALEVIALPTPRHGIAFEPRVLVVVRGSGGSAQRKAEVLRSVFSLTSAEAEIALLLTKGNTPETIANVRGVSVGTVRVQIKSILAKLGVARQIELVARLNQL